MSKFILQFLILVLLVCNIAYASDDYNYFAKEKLLIKTEADVSNKTDKSGYISLPHASNEKDTMNCIVDNFVVDLDASHQVSLSFEDNVHSALIRIKEEIHQNSAPVVDVQLKKDDASKRPIKFKTTSKLAAGKYIFEVHSFVNNIPSDKKTHYYLWMKTETLDSILTNQPSGNNSIFQLWLKKFLDKVNGPFLYFSSVIVVIMIAVILTKEVNKNAR